MVKKYRKKPVVIEAMLLDKTNLVTAAKWCDSRADPLGRGVKIQTLEGVMFGELGDYIIKGVKGEFYPCKPDIFAATYEEVES